MSVSQIRIKIELGSTYLNRSGGKTMITYCNNQPWPCYKDTSGNKYNKYGRVWNSEGEQPMDLISEATTETLKETNMTEPKLKTTAKPLTCLLTLQPGKTYVTKEGQNITVKPLDHVRNSSKFIGSNNVYYSSSGYADPLSHFNSSRSDISHELIQDTEDENWHDSPCDDCYNDCDECEISLDETPEVHLIDVLKFKQKSNGVKRKLLLKDYSDDSVEIIFKTKFSKDEPQVTTGIRLSYEAVLMLFDSLEYMLDENQRTLH